MLCAALLCGAVAPAGAAGGEGAIWERTGLLAQRALEENQERSGREIPRQVEAVMEERAADRDPSPALALLFSAAIPGAGQIYTGKRRALVYLALEAAALVAHFSFKSDGEKTEDEYRDFADAQWDTLRYRDGSGEPGCTWSAEDEATIVELMEIDRGRFYEQIARDDYACGWREPWQLDAYRDLRKVANDLKGRANTALTILFLNHLISAIDAFRAARSMKLEVSPGTELRMDVEGSLRQPRALIRLIHHL